MNRAPVMCPKWFNIISLRNPENDRGVDNPLTKMGGGGFINPPGMYKPLQMPQNKDKVIHIINVTCIYSKWPHISIHKTFVYFFVQLSIWHNVN